MRPMPWLVLVALAAPALTRAAPPGAYVVSDRDHRFTVEGALAPAGVPIPSTAAEGFDVALWARSALYAVETRRGPDPCNDGRDGLQTVALYTLEAGPESVVTSNPGARTASVFLSGKMTRHVPAPDYCESSRFVVAAEDLGVFRMAWPTTGHVSPTTFTANDRDSSPSARLPTLDAVCERAMAQVVPTYRSLASDDRAASPSGAQRGGSTAGAQRGGGTLSLPPAPPGLLAGDATVFVQGMHGLQSSAAAAQVAQNTRTFITQIADIHYGKPGKALQSLGRGIGMSALNDMASRHISSTANDFLGGLGRMMEKYQQRDSLPDRVVVALEEPSSGDRYYSALSEHFVGMMKDTCDTLAGLDDGARPDAASHGFLYGPGVGTRLSGWAPMGAPSAHAAGAAPGTDVAAMLGQLQASGMEIPAIAPEHLALITAQKPWLQATAGTARLSFPQTPELQVHLRVQLLDAQPPLAEPIVSPSDPRRVLPAAAAEAKCAAPPPVRFGEIYFGADGAPDWVELHQAPLPPPPGASRGIGGDTRSVPMSGWHFESGPRRYAIPHDTVLTAGGALLLRGEDFGFDLHLGGPGLRVTDAEGCVVDQVQPLPPPYGLDVPPGHTHQREERLTDGVRSLRWQASAAPGGTPGTR